MQPTPLLLSAEEGAPVSSAGRAPPETSVIRNSEVALLSVAAPTKGRDPQAGTRMQPGTFPTFDGHRMTYQCLHPGCHRRLLDADASHKHAISFHASWLQTLPLHAHYCQEVLGSPATWESGYVTIGPDGSLGDGSAMRPLDNTQTFHIIVYDEATAPAPSARTAPECLDQLDESWRPSGAVC